MFWGINPIFDTFHSWSYLTPSSRYMYDNAFIMCIYHFFTPYLCRVFIVPFSYPYIYTYILYIYIYMCYECKIIYSIIIISFVQIKILQRYWIVVYLLQSTSADGYPFKIYRSSTHGPASASQWGRDTCWLEVVVCLCLSEDSRFPLVSVASLDPVNLIMGCDRRCWFAILQSSPKKHKIPSPWY